MKMQIVQVEEAVGMVLCHDITKIVPGEFKGQAFAKGHEIKIGDIPELLKLGKEHIYVWEAAAGLVHEDDAAISIAQLIKGEGLEMTPPKEGKVNLLATSDGMVAINEKCLMKINAIDQIVVATLNNAKPVKKGEIIAGIRVVPLMIEEAKLKQVENIKNVGGTIAMIPYIPRQVGIITTGSEVFHGRIPDKFGPVVKTKVESFGCEVATQTIVPDDDVQIAQMIQKYADGGIELILITGGMSVDPDDVTPSGIIKAGAEIITYGAPVLPGSMLVVAYLGKIPIVGLPGCVMYHKTTVFDLVLPIIMTGRKVKRSDITKLGMGGLCLQCEICRYPACSFGTGA